MAELVSAGVTSGKYSITLFILILRFSEDNKSIRTRLANFSKLEKNGLWSSKEKRNGFPWYEIFRKIFRLKKNVFTAFEFQANML